MKIALADTDAEIEPVPTSGGGHKPAPELDRLSNILKTFNDNFGTLFTDGDRVTKRIRDDIVPKVAADLAYQNARANTPTPRAWPTTRRWARSCSSCSRTTPILRNGHKPCKLLKAGSGPGAMAGLPCWRTSRMSVFMFGASAVSFTMTPIDRTPIISFELEG